MAHAKPPANATALTHFRSPLQKNSMAFNHYARLKTILENEPDGWIIRRINKHMSVKNFKNETLEFPITTDSMILAACP